MLFVRMKMMKVIVLQVLLSRVGGLQHTVVPASRSRRMVGCRMSDGPVSYLSNIEAAGAEKKKAWEEETFEDPRAQVKATEEVNGAPANYDGFIDSDGFDGGDGQVGVVGDGTNAMESFDTSQSVQVRGNAIGGAESKQTQKNAWGYSTGYADELAKRGMVDIDEFGEDRLKARRQQLENWQNQKEIRNQKQSQIQELAQLQGKSFNSGLQGSYLDELAGPAKAPTSTPTDQIFFLQPKATSDGHIEILAPFNGRGGTTLAVQNEYSTYAEFKAGFAPGSHPAFSVEPALGTLNRRGGQPQDFIFKFKPETVGQTEYRAVFVVETEDHKWTYTVGGILT